MDKEVVMKMFMVAMSMDEYEILNNTIDEIIAYKEALFTWNNDKNRLERPEPPLAQVMLLLTKFQTIDLSYQEIFKMVSEQTDVIGTASELHQMLDDQNKP